MIQDDSRFPPSPAESEAFSDSPPAPAAPLPAPPRSRREWTGRQRERGHSTGPHVKAKLSYPTTTRGIPARRCIREQTRGRTRARGNLRRAVVQHPAESRFLRNLRKSIPGDSKSRHVHARTRTAGIARVLAGHKFLLVVNRRGGDGARLIHPASFTFRVISPEKMRAAQICALVLAVSCVSTAVAAKAAASGGPRARQGNINDVEHIVVFMQENRAFDHYGACHPA